MKLRFMEGPRVGRLVDLDQDEMTLGRDDECELKLDQDGISREHARIIRDGDSYTIEDLNSTNGVYVNGKKIEGKKELKLNDKIRISGVLLLMTDAADILDTAEVEKLQSAVTATAKKAGAEKASEPSEPSPAKPAVVGKSEDKANKIITTVFAVIMAVLAGLLVVLLVLPSGNSENGSSANVEVRDPGSDDPELPIAPDPGEPVAGDDDDGESASAVDGDGQLAAAGDDDDDDDVGDDDDDDEAETPDDPPGFSSRSEKLTYYWVRSTPPGATIYVNGEEQGTTPKMLFGLPRGAHDLKLTKPGYKDLTRVFHVPFRSRFFNYSLDLKSGHCLITSEPSGMAIMEGSLLIGHTPYLLQAPPGQYSYRMVGAGYAAKPFIAMVSKDRPTKVNMEMRLLVGSLRVVTLPAGATVYVDGVAVGQTPEANRGDSDPLQVSGIRPGVHKISIKVNDKYSPEQTVSIRPGELENVGLMVYQPDTEIRTRDNKRLLGMFRKKSPNGDILLAVRSDKSVVVKSANIQQIQFLESPAPAPPDDQTE